MLDSERYLDRRETIELPDISMNLMSREAYEYLERSLLDIENRLKEANLSVGEAGGTSDWHDNFAFEEAHRQVAFYTSRLRMIKNQMSNAIFISPRKETDIVGLGNAVELRCEGKEENETFLILGPADTLFRENCISYRTPVAQQILGQSIGRIIEYEIDGDKTKMVIVRILPGNF